MTLAPISSVLTILLMAIVPALGWISVYYYLDNRDPEPKLAIVVSVLLGMLSTVPIFGLQYVFNNYPQYDLVSLVQSRVDSAFYFAIGFLIFVSVIEEASKGIAFLITEKFHQKVFNQVVDGIVYGACIGLGFAIAENTYYFLKAMDTFEWSSEFIAIFSIRSFGTMLAHSLFTGIFGFYFAQAYFAPFLSKAGMSDGTGRFRRFRTQFKQAIRLNATFFYLLPQQGEPRFEMDRNTIVFEGFLVAVFLHFLYNFFIKIELFGSHWTFLIVPLLFLMSWYLWSRFFIPVYIRIVDFIRVRKERFRVSIH